MPWYSLSCKKELPNKKLTFWEIVLPFILILMAAHKFPPLFKQEMFRHIHKLFHLKKSRRECSLGRRFILYKVRFCVCLILRNRWKRGWFVQSLTGTKVSAIFADWAAAAMGEKQKFICFGNWHVVLWYEYLQGTLQLKKRKCNIQTTKKESA